MHSVQFSPLVVGTMRLGIWGASMNTAQLQAFMEECLGLGLTTIDHADIYGDYTTEGDFGRMLKQAPQLREQMQLVTKYGIRRVCSQRPNHKIKSYDASVTHLIASVENSLKELHTDYIDVLLIHRPDILMEPEEIAEAVSQLQEAGKLRAFGVSNFTPSQFDVLNAYVPLCTNQVEASLLHLDCFQDGTFDQCLKHKVRPMAWSPLGGGGLFADNPSERVARIRMVAAPLMEKYGLSLDQLALAWLMRHPAGILPVLGTTKISRIHAAAKALDTQMSRVDWYDLWQASTMTRLP